MKPWREISACPLCSWDVSQARWKKFFFPKSPKSLKRWHTQPVCGWLKQSLVTRLITAISKGFSFFFHPEKLFKLLQAERLRSRLSFSKGTPGGRDKKQLNHQFVLTEASLVSSSCRLTQFAADCYFLLIAARLQKIFWELFHGFESSLSLTMSSLWLLLFIYFCHQHCFRIVWAFGNMILTHWIEIHMQQSILWPR